MISGYCVPVPLGVTRCGTAATGASLYEDFRETVTGARWVTGEADLIPDLEYCQDFKKAGLGKIQRFIDQGNSIGANYEVLIRKSGSVNTDGAPNYAGLIKGFQVGYFIFLLAVCSSQKN